MRFFMALNLLLIAIKKGRFNFIYFLFSYVYVFKGIQAFAEAKVSAKKR